MACPKQPAAARGLGRAQVLLLRRRSKHLREGDALGAATLRRLARRGSRGECSLQVCGAAALACIEPDAHIALGTASRQRPSCTHRSLSHDVLASRLCQVSALRHPPAHADSSRLMCLLHSCARGQRLVGATDICMSF